MQLSNVNLTLTPIVLSIIETADVMVTSYITFSRIFKEWNEKEEAYSASSKDRNVLLIRQMSDQTSLSCPGRYSGSSVVKDIRLLLV